MQRKKTVLSITLALGLAQSPTHAQFDPVIQLSDLDGTTGFRLDGVAASDESGRSVSVAGDVNGDGIDDVIIGANRGGSNGYESGSSYVVFGKSTPFTATQNLSTLDGSNGFRLDGVAAGDRSGFAVSTAGDVNGDGFDDLIIGAFGADPNGSYSGSSYVVFGKSTPFASTQNLNNLNGSNGFRLDGEGINDNSGFAVSAAGDVNGDGFDDLIIGAYSASPNGTLSGRSYVIFGSSSPFNATMNLSVVDGSNGFRLDGAEEDRSGYAVSAAGDINGDGIDDLIIGAYGADPNGIFSGSSYVLFGKNTAFTATLNLSALDGTNGFRLDGVTANDISGKAVSAAGDINDDGVDDLIIGAPFTDPNGNSSGSSYLMFGKKTPFISTQNLSTLDGSNGFRLDGTYARQENAYFVSC